MKRIRHAHRFAATLLISCAALIAQKDASAVGTRTFRLDSLADLTGGDLQGTSVDSRGQVRAGLNLGKLALPEVGSVWCSLAQADGSVLIGTGNAGKIFRVSGGQVTEFASTGQMAVTALSPDPKGGVLAATIPNGKILRIDAAGKSTTLVDLPNTEHVWALAYDAKSKSTYAATGPDGKLFRIDEAGRAQVHFDSEEAHLISLALAADGTVYAGSSGNALLYKITGPGRASVVHDFAGQDVKALAIGRDGRLYSISNEYPAPPAVPRRNRSASDPAEPAKSPAAKPGKGTLTRFETNGRAEQLLFDKDKHFQSLTLGEDGLPYVGTGDGGEVFAVDDNHTSILMADTEERQVGSMLLVGNRKYIVTSDPAVFHEVRSLGGPDSVWTSKVLDAGLRAHFGRLMWNANGQIELSTRTGLTEKPDATWSDWSAPLAAPSDITSPAGRFFQVRARFARDPKAILSLVEIPFVTDNARPVVTSIDAAMKGSPTPSSSKDLPSSGEEPPKHSSQIKVSWKVDNQDNDQLRYRVSYRLEGAITWRAAMAAEDVHTKTDFEWETAGLPEGTYRVRIDVSDELANPPQNTLRHTLESQSITVDNTPPAFQRFAANGKKLQVTAVDGLGPITRLDVSIDSQAKVWAPYFPQDGLFDEASEDFDLDLTPLLDGTGPRTVAVRVFDRAGNATVRSIDIR